MSNRTPQFLPCLRRLGRPSTYARALWLSVALLHAWLVVQRFSVHEWADLFDIVRGALCIAGVAYASLKFWRVATVFDAAPRRALIFGLILLLGHWLLAAPGQYGPSLFDGPGRAPVAAVIMLVPALGLALLLTDTGRRLGRSLALRRLHRAAGRLRLFSLERRPRALRRQFCTLFHRPPPCLA